MRRFGDTWRSKALSCQQAPKNMFVNSKHERTKFIVSMRIKGQSYTARGGQKTVFYSLILFKFYSSENFYSENLINLNPWFCFWELG